MTLLFSLCSVMLSIAFLLGSSPLFMSAVIILQTIALAITISLFAVSSWFSYMLLMIYLSGMMIVFIYISSMASNELFRLNISLPFILLLLLIIASALYFSPHILAPSDSTNLLDLTLTQASVVKTTKMYSKSLFMMTILLIIYLLLAMIMVVNASSFSEGPLRSAK
uniref:NADH-ubiquinone oxidoreductase chain 6 n=1 Tax=Pseudoniphargus grandis TaxID=2211498 RepID=A0A345UDQ8_9CRUS|nr:NADH dehydrogenase subunit 6 [Pseudoniphargus grandis]